MSEQPDVDRDQAAGFLRSQLGAGVTDVVVAPRQGAWSRAYFFRYEGADFVIRFAPSPDNFDKDRIAGGYASIDLPIPPVTEVGETLSCSYAISQRAFGSFLEALGPEDARRALPSLLHVLDAMREADVSSTAGYGSWERDGTGGYPTWRDYLLSVGTDLPAHATHGWRERLATRPSAERAFDDSSAQLPSLVAACPEIRHLIHSDLLYGNVLVDRDRVSGIFDWGCALYGDFVYDLAWLTFWAPWHPGLAALDVRTAALRHYESIGVDVPEFDARLRCYEVHLGLATEGYQALIGHWEDLEATRRRVGQLLDGDRLSLASPPPCGSRT